MKKITSAEAQLMNKGYDHCYNDIFTEASSEASVKYICTYVLQHESGNAALVLVGISGCLREVRIPDEYLVRELEIFEIVD